MPYSLKQNLILLAVFIKLFTPVKVQIPMPVYVPAAMPQPVFAVPAPVPIAVAIQLPEGQIRRTTTTTTTTTPEPHYAIAVPVPVPLPMPVQFAVPAQPPPASCQAKPKAKACPPCPPCVCLPSCTPAFFSYCSPCHQKCRCRTPTDAPEPLPPSPPVPARVPVPVPGPVYPVPLVPAPIGPPPVVVVPLPPIIQRPDATSSSESDTSDSCENNCDRYYLRSGRRSRKTVKIHKRKYRRDAGDESEGNNDLVKPILSYVSENGDVKFKTRLSNRDALKLLSERNVKTSNEKQPDMESDHDDSMVITKGKQKSGRRYNRVLLRNSPTGHELRKGINEFVFKPSSQKQIESVAVSFKVT